ncbi:N-acetyltransferase family protein [Actinoplanes sp. CA-015351]|uniref:GNAT family N-acetyltransferase n=1 Tax=Actinoplanes sp. CA-015351 TaxID=3239897 RepID=UPI003D96EA83
MQLRAADLTDLPALLDVQQSGAILALSHIFPQDRHPFPRAELHQRWTAEITGADVDAFVIEQAGTLAGFAALRSDEFLHFGTAPATWGTGLAAAAHAALLPTFQARGVRTPRLHVFAANHRARRFYEKLGWQPTGRSRQTSFPPHPVLLEYNLTF